MKRIAAILFLAGLGGGCATTDKGKLTAMKPVNATTAAKATTGGSGVIQASATTTTIDPSVQQTSGFARVIGKGSCDGGCGGGISLGGHCEGGHCGSGGYAGHGITPVPPMGPWGAVAAVGAIGPGMGIPMASNMRTAIKFIGNAKVTWYANGTYVEPGLSMPAEYNFVQGNIYSLKISGIASKPGKVYYPTLEVAAATPKSLTFLDHGTVPVSFTDEDLARVDSGNLVTKVIYLPDSLYQDVTAVGGAEEVVSTQLDPGADPVVEANRRGTILAIIRVGNINRENPNSPAKDAPPTGVPNMTPAAPPMPMSTPMTMTPGAMPSIMTGTMLK